MSIEGNDNQLVRIELCGKSLDLDIAGDYYGEEFWTKIQNHEYEPDTLDFICTRANTNVDFMDIGAANGAMSLIAAVRGARVQAFEPDPQIRKVLQRNVELNNRVGHISISGAAISNFKGELLFDKRANAQVLSDIMFAGEKEKGATILVADLSGELDKFHIDSNRKLVIKMDIEGAEWKTLNDLQALTCLKKHNATLLLAVHPGFTHPVPKFAGHSLLFRAPWLIRQILDSINLFKKLSMSATIQRTNLNFITSKFKFATLIISGYHEFIIEF